ncbi:GntR family transcriptional regulator [Corynebacterium glutamicum]|uniref:GntR family transcriptional regulator n=1 Tax=Corynebacterium glutamicum TaxID=1718 RepID=A0AB36IGD2_CORGT|nr:GntR family transcriptional regulator [Corynebacterium glutamicum]OKX81884.1 GntR family transcriptional regulator [Corynebacterium glutamicum]
MSNENWPDHVDTQRFSRLTLKSSTEELLRNYLLDGDMKPGEIYSANALAKKLGTSNSPVCEAMTSLVHRGLLELVPNRGFRVIELTEQDHREIYILRSIVEVQAVRELARRGITADQGSELHRLAAQTLTIITAKNPPDLTKYLEADDAFHGYLITLLDNRRLQDIVLNLRDQSRINGAYRRLPEQGLLIPSAQEHIELATAIVSQEPENAARVMLQHLEYARPKSLSPEIEPALHMDYPTA